MAKKTVESTDAVTVKKWQEEAHREMFAKSYWARFTGEATPTKSGSEAKDGLVYVKRDLEKGQGDETTITFIPKLRNRARKNDQKMEGYEEELKHYTDTQKLDLYRLAVRTNGPLDIKRPVFDLMKEHKHFLTYGGAEELDRQCFEALKSSPTRTFYIDTNGIVRNTTTFATAKAGITDAASKLDDFEIFAYLKAFAKNGGYNHTTSYREQNPIPPIMVNGEPFYVLLVSEDVAVSLRTSSAYEQANREARERSAKNPIFLGAEMVYNGVIVHTHEFIDLELDGGAGSDVPFSQCHFMGQGALTVRFGKRPYMTYGEFDYQKEKGHCWNAIWNVKKCKFQLDDTSNQFDYGSFSVLFSRLRVNDPA